MTQLAKYKILIDMDDVMENLLECWVAALNEKHGTTVTIDDIVEWDMRKAFPTIEADQLYEPLTQEDFWKRLKPLDGAVHYIKRLIDDGHEIYVVTASHYATVKHKAEHVLLKYFPFIPWENVIVTSNKQMIKGDILIDDAEHNITGGDCFKLLMDMPHNRNVDCEEHNAIRVKSWEEIYYIISISALLDGDEGEKVYNVLMNELEGTR